MPAMEMVEDYSYLILTGGFILGGALIIVTDIVINKLCMPIPTASIIAATASTVCPEASAPKATPTAIPSGMLCMVTAIHITAQLRLLAQLSGAVEIVAGVIGALAVTAVSGILPWALSFSAGAMLGQLYFYTNYVTFKSF